MTREFRPVPKPQPRPKRAAKPLPKVNPVRAAKRYERDFGEKGDWIRTLACCCTRRFTGQWFVDAIEGERVLVRIVAAHFPSRGAGGRSQDLVPLADHLHRRGHDSKGEKGLERTFNVNFRILAAYYEQLWQRREARRLAPRGDPK